MGGRPSENHPSHISERESSADLVGVGYAAANSVLDTVMGNGIKLYEVGEGPCRSRVEHGPFLVLYEAGGQTDAIPLFRAVRGAEPPV